ncbi:hypothetical protein J7E68_00205 [Microbacterium sp. ISL-103]|jgi:hypothetical protein|uniref:hypothetical protein n=1 Tax=Microbacterium sp. ISL-103 TaxID=2819156 RepID=UPI001BE852C4|nr:hypothetical protein [Microbacterium sp. ISL-103]MBT2473046.1 hypothetical protein [Microbacterium sp. ISL-103]
MADESDPSSPRQQVVRVPGRRRAQLTPVAGTDTDPEHAPGERPKKPSGPKGPNDDQLMQDVPPHY